ncbi:cytochrome b [Serratia sp. L9]|uniref:cytochrome b n=1 Tax=Serratia sp. L9 TaxID=3423946 RepID=UPI003D6704B0
MTIKSHSHSSRYDPFSRILHWVLAIGIIYAAIVGYGLHFISNPQVFNFFSELNMSLATLMTALMIIRFIWRFFRPAVPYGEQIRGHKKGLVVLLHEVFYLIIFVVLISGFLMLEHGYSLFGLVDIPQPLNNLEVNRFFFTVHRYSCIALSAMLLMHISAVIKHQWVDKNPILSRMV